jgi:DNA polymerase
MRACQACGLAATRTSVVVGDGPADAAVVFLGEAPGAQEDLVGRPFVGRSGTLLRRVWAEVAPDLAPFITNTVRCRPPANRRPHESEVTACAAWRTAELRALTAPKVLVLLGRTAAMAAAATWTSGRVWRGWLPEHALDLPTCVVWHPAAVLRSPTRQPAWRDALADVARVARGGAMPAPLVVGDVP